LNIIIAGHAGLRSQRRHNMVPHVSALRFGAWTVACMTRLVIFSLIGFVAVALLFAGLLWLPEVNASIRDRSSNRQAYETVVRPASDWVRAFYQQHSRLPTDAELEGYARTNWPSFSVGIYDSPPGWQHTWGRSGVDFMVDVHTGEWNLYRQSWDGGEWKAWTD
jgi:hypothetical protein